MKTKTIEYLGHEFEYDDSCTRSWRWQKRMSSPDRGAQLRALTQLLCGRDEYYAYVLGTDDPISYEEYEALTDDERDALGEECGDLMPGLFEAILAEMDQTAKN